TAPIEATTWARADPTIGGEAVSAIAANTNIAVAHSAGTRADALLARELAAANQFHFLVPAERLVAQRSESAAPAEGLLWALADAVVTGEGAAQLVIDPAMPTEQGSVAVVLLLSALAENGALLSGEAILTAESLSGAARAVALLAPIEALASTP